MKAFLYKDQLYLRCVPAKTLFHSTLVHEVVNRGDIFAINCDTSALTIIPGSAQVEHLDATVLTSAIASARSRQDAAVQRLRRIRDFLNDGEDLASAKIKASQEELPL